MSSVGGHRVQARGRVLPFRGSCTLLRVSSKSQDQRQHKLTDSIPHYLFCRAWILTLYPLPKGAFPGAPPAMDFEWNNIAVVPGAFKISYSWLSQEKLKSVQRSSNWTEVINNLCLSIFPLPILCLSFFPLLWFQNALFWTHPVFIARVHIFLVNVSCECVLVDCMFPTAGIPSHLSPQVKGKIGDSRCDWQREASDNWRRPTGSFSSSVSIYYKHKFWQ